MDRQIACNRRVSMWHYRSLCRFLLAVIGPAALLAACARPAPTVEPVTITFACMDYQRTLYEPLVEGFHAASPDIRVQFVSADEASGMQREGSTVTMDGKEVERLASHADTFVWYALSALREPWFLLDLQPFAEASSFQAADLYPGTLDLFRWQGRLCGLPAEVTPQLIFYDKGIFDQAGVPYPHIGWTWDDFLHAASQLTEQEGERVIRYGAAERLTFVLEMMEQYGVSLWDEAVSPSDGPSMPLFDTPQVANVLRRYTDMILTYHVMAGRDVVGISEIANLIDEGKVAMWPSYAYERQYHSMRANLGVAPFPEDVAAANPHSVTGFFISAGTAHPEAAWRWLTYLSENYQPPSFMDGTLPARRSVTEQVSWWKALDEETRAVFEYALAHPASPRSPLSNLLYGAADAVLEDGASVEEALAVAQSEALKRQSELAAATPPAPQPVVTLRPTPKVRAVVAFAPSPDAELAAYRTLAAAFHEDHPDVQIEIVPAPVDLAELATTADCFGGMYSVYAPDMRQHIHSLEPLLEADAGFDLDDYCPQFLEALQHDGELWGLPYQADALMVYYNPDLFAEAGVTPPGPDWSFKDLMDAAVALSVDGQYGFTTCEGAYGDLIFVLERMGARLYDDTCEPPMPTFGDPTVVAALGRYADLFRGQSLSPGTPSTQSGWPDAVVKGSHPSGVQSEQVAMWIDSIESYAFAPPLPFEAGVAPLPRGTQASTEFTVRAYYISAHADDPEACWEWLKFLSDRTEAVHLLPARHSVAASPAWQGQAGAAAMPAYQATLAYDDTDILRLRWKIRWLAYAYPWLDEAFQVVLAGGNTKPALAEAQRKAETYLLCLEREDGFANPDVLKTCAQEVDPDYPIR
jgi:multiple sugar transport system substrate-binding protein